MSNKKVFSILFIIFFVMLFFNIVTAPTPKQEEQVAPKAVDPAKALARAKDNAKILKTENATFENVQQLDFWIAKIPKTAKEYNEAQELLKELDPINKKIIAKAEKEQKEKDAAQAKMNAVLEEDKRIKFASMTEYAFLDNRMNVTVTTFGKNNKQLKLKYALMSKVFIHQVLKTDFVKNTKSLGFTKITFTDGYNDTFTLELKDL